MSNPQEIPKNMKFVILILLKLVTATNVEFLVRFYERRQIW